MKARIKAFWLKRKLRIEHWIQRNLSGLLKVGLISASIFMTCAIISDFILNNRSAKETFIIATSVVIVLFVRLIVFGIDKRCKNK